MKITFMGAGSTVFAKNVIGDCMMCPSLQDAEFALYDIDPQRLEESRIVTEHLNRELAGGKSVSSQQNVPAQFMNIQGKPVIVYSLEIYLVNVIITVEAPVLSRWLGFGMGYGVYYAVGFVLTILLAVGLHRLLDWGVKLLENRIKVVTNI